MTDTEHSSDDGSLNHELVYSRHYRVAIAIDSVDNQVIIPAEAESGARNRYRCCRCGHFLRLVTRWKKSVRTREKWFFAHAPHERLQCGGESYDHAIAIAAATWVLTRHLQGQTTVRTEHRCARCDETSRHDLPRDGLQVVPDQLYPGTSWRSDLALADAAGCPRWGLEVLKTHPVDPAKAQGIPCSWAEVTTAHLLAVIADPKRRSKREVILPAEQGRPDAVPLPSSGTWQCEVCRALPPPYRLPRDAAAAGTTAVSPKAAEQSRRRVVRVLARLLASASAHTPLLLHLPEHCPSHNVPLVLPFDGFQQAINITTPRQRARSLSWDIILEVVVASNRHPPRPLMVLIVGDRPHPTARGDHVDLPSPDPFLVITQSTVTTGRAVACAAHKVDALIWCPICQEERRAAEAEAQQVQQQLDESEARIDAYAVACNRFLEDRELAWQDGEPAAEWPMKHRIERHLTFVIAPLHQTMMRCAQALNDADLRRMYERRDHDGSFSGFIPPGGVCRATDLIHYLHEQHGIGQLQVRLLDEAHQRLVTYTARAQRRIDWGKAGRELVACLQRMSAWHAPVESPPPIALPGSMVEEYSRAFASLLSVGHVVRASDAAYLWDGAADYFDPLTNHDSRTGIIHQDDALDRLHDAFHPERIISRETTRILRVWELTCKNHRRTELLTMVYEIEQLIKQGLDAQIGRSPTAADFRRRIDAHCADLIARVAAVRTLLVVVEREHFGDGAVHAVPVRLTRCEPSCSNDYWHARYRDEIRALAHADKGRRDIARLEEVIAHNTKASLPPVPLVVDVRPQLKAVYAAIHQLRSYLQVVPPEQEWDLAGAAVPAQVRSAIQALPLPHWPPWLAAIVPVLQAGPLTLTSTAKREQLLRLTDLVPGDDSAK